MAKKKVAAPALAKKAPKHPQIARLTAVIEQLLEVIDEQPAPLEDLCLAAAKARHVLNRGGGRPRDVDKIDLVRALHGDGKTIRQIHTETGIAESTIARYIGKAKSKSTPTT
jgi:hypothetical protein